MPVFTIKAKDGSAIIEDKYLPRVLGVLSGLSHNDPHSFYIDDKLIFTVNPETVTIEPDTKVDLLKMLYASQPRRRVELLSED